MTFKNLLLVTGLVVLLDGICHSSAQTAQNAIGNNINTCLFHAWTTMANPVLARDVECTSYGTNYKELCYAVTASSPTKLAICYNQLTKTPAFTGNKIIPGSGAGTRPPFKKETGPYAPTTQAEVADYTVSQQMIDFAYTGRFDERSQHFCAKGHLTPNSDFGPANERALTFILTNIAPQWQKFNGGNWAILENGVRSYVNGRTKTVYVFTGVGGEARDQYGTIYKMNNQVTAPQYYWKLICDPSIGQMIVYVGKNDVGSITTTTSPGCRGLPQTVEQGVMDCDSYTNINAKYRNFKLPDMSTNCPVGTRGNFLDSFVTFK